ncbi:germ cell nuclear acidic protein-like [Triplophysa dalaica]|uniref:germ cell nuclear acidic protein-like n=1 Tax=Triplophysa dalaica TaxID=1582913 RepID=UPI0024DF54CA|nr:germ cell nuclear acidic protein-like [Triplophysa dalaica]
MAVCKVRGNEFVILCAFTFITLIHCRSLPPLSGTQTTSDEGDKMLSDMSDQAGLDEQIADFADPIDDDTIFDVSSDGDETLSDESDQEGLDDSIHDNSLSALPRSAVERSSDDETLSDESDQEGLDDHIDDDVLSDETSDGEETLSDESDQEGLDDHIDDDVLSDETSDGEETLSDESDQEGLDDHIDDDVLSDVTSDGEETLSDESDQEVLDDHIDDDVLSDETLSDESDQEGLDDHIDDDVLSALPRSAVETSSDDETLSDESDQEELDDALGQLESSSEGPWDAMSPKLRCGGDLMNLQLFGSDVDQVELCRGDSAPVPLGRLPPNCGRTSATHGGLVFATPYDGCGVAQQGGNYVMQMLWQGKPVVISCPMT